MQHHIHRTFFVLSVVVLSAVVCPNETIALTRLASQLQELGNVSRDGRTATSPGEKIVLATGSKIVLLDRASKAVLWESKGLHGAYCIAALPAGGFVVGEGKSIARVDENGRVVSRASANFNLTTDVKLLESGRMLVSDGPAGTVVEMDWSGEISWSLRGLHYPSEAVRLENGDTLVADGTAELKQFDSAGKLVGTTRLQRWAASVQRVSGGHTLVGEREAVELLDGTGRAIWSQTTTSRVTGVQQLTNGEYLIAEPDSERIVILDAQGKITWEVTGLGTPWRAIYVR